METYAIEIRGHVLEEEINAASPIKIQVEQVSAYSTLLTACTDQSGLIGLIRHLHNLGFVLLAFCARTQRPTDLGNEPPSTKPA